MFDLDERYGALSAAGDPLERLRSVADLELFRGELDAALERSDRARGGPGSSRPSNGRDVPFVSITPAAQHQNLDGPPRALEQVQASGSQ